MIEKATNRHLLQPNYGTEVMDRYTMARCYEFLSVGSVRDNG